MFQMSRALFALLLVTAASSCSSPDSLGCDSDGQCRDGRVCIDGKCQTPGGGANNNAPDTGGVDMGADVDMSTPNNVLFDVGPANNNVTNPDVELCARFCDLLLGSCVDRVCDVSPTVRSALDALIDNCMYTGFNEGEPGCVDALAQDPGVRRDVEAAVDNLACEGPDLTQFRCSELDLGEACGCDPVLYPDIGNSCTSQDDCNGGGLPGVCVDETNDPPFPDGYCTSFGCPVDAANPEARLDDICGVDNVCLPVGEPQTGICLERCDRHTDCRNQYQCRLVGATPDLEALRVCAPECGPNLPCNPNERCADGHCELQCTPNGSMGEPPGRAICQALGFECQPDDAGVEWCVMP